MTDERQIPSYKDLYWPTLKALKDRGGSASIQELSEQVATDLALPDKLLDVPHKDGPQSEVDYRAAWVRTNLQFAGAIDNTSRGIWTITDVGRRIQTEQEMHDLVRLGRAKQNKARRSRNAEPDKDDVTDEQDWKKALLSIVRRMEPAVLAPFTVGDVCASLCKIGAYAPFSAQRRSRALFWL